MAHSANNTTTYFGDVEVRFEKDPITDLYVHRSIYRDNITNDDKEFHFYKYDAEVEGFERGGDLSVTSLVGLQEEIGNEVSDLVKTSLEDAIGLEGIHSIESPADATKVGQCIKRLKNIAVQLPRRALDLVAAVQDQNVADALNELLGNDVNTILTIADHNRRILERSLDGFNNGRFRRGVGNNDDTVAEEREAENDNEDNGNDDDDNEVASISEVLMTDDVDMENAIRTGARPKTTVATVSPAPPITARRASTPMPVMGASAGVQPPSRPGSALGGALSLAAGGARALQAAGGNDLQNPRSRSVPRTALSELPQLHIDDALIEHCRNYRPGVFMPDSYHARLRMVFDVFNKKLTGDIATDQIALDAMLAAVLQHKFTQDMHHQDNVKRAAKAGDKEAYRLSDGTSVVRTLAAADKLGKDIGAKTSRDFEVLNVELREKGRALDDINNSIRHLSNGVSSSQVNQRVFEENLRSAGADNNANTGAAAPSQVSAPQAAARSSRQQQGLNPQVAAIIEKAKTQHERMHKVHFTGSEAAAPAQEVAASNDNAARSTNQSFISGMSEGVVVNTAEGALSHAQSTPMHSSSSQLSGQVSQASSRMQQTVAGGLYGGVAPSVFAPRPRLSTSDRYGTSHSIPSAIAAQRHLEQQSQTGERSSENRSILHPASQGHSNDSRTEDDVIKKLNAVVIPDRPYFHVPADSVNRKELNEILEIAHNLYLHLKTMLKTATTIAAVDSMDSQQRTDAYNNMSKVETKNMKLADLRLSFSKKLVELDTVQNVMPPDDVIMLHNLNEVAKTLGEIVVDLVSRATDFLSKENVTSAPISTHDASKVEYYVFSGETSLESKTIYEFFDNHKRNFAKLKTNSAVKAAITKHNLKGIALATIPDHLDEFADIEAILMKKFGDPYKLCRAFEAIHREVGQCLSKHNAAGPEWRKLAEVSGKHIALMKRKTELTQIFRPDIKQELFHPNYVMLLSELLPPEDSYIVHSQVSEDPKRAYYIIKEIFLELFNTAHQLGARYADKPKRKQPAAPIEGPCLAAGAGSAAGGSMTPGGDQGASSNGGNNPANTNGSSGGNNGGNYGGRNNGNYNGRGANNYGNNNRGGNGGARSNGNGGRNNGKNGSRAYNNGGGAGYGRSNRGDNRPNIIIKDHPGCIICSKLQHDGRGSDHFKNHLYSVNFNNGKEYSHPANCPNYLELGITGRDEFLKSAKICQYCLVELDHHDSERCNELSYARRAKCAVQGCMKRVELCHEHTENNKEKVQAKKDFLKDKNINFVMNASGGQRR